MPARSRPEVETTLPHLFDVHDVARLLGRSAATVYRLRAQGRLPAGSQSTGRLLWTRHELERWFGELE